MSTLFNIPAPPTPKPPPAPVRPDALPGPYVTQLPPDDEVRFQQWVKQNNVPSQTASEKPDPQFLAPDNDYDMRGFWKAQQSGDASARRSTLNQHFPDTYKTPYHESFSNESKYALPVAPHWQGQQLVDNKGKVVFQEPPFSRLGKKQ